MFIAVVSKWQNLLECLLFVLSIFSNHSMKIMCYLDNLKDNGNCNAFVVSPLGGLCWLWVEIAVYLLRIFSILFVRVLFLN